MDNYVEVIYNSLTSDLANTTTTNDNTNHTTSSKESGNHQPIWRSFDNQSQKSESSSSSKGAATYITHSVDESMFDATTSQASPPTSVRAKQEKEIFDKARQYLHPGIFFRYFTFLYAERKLLTFFWVHFVATLVVWGHFAMQKFDQQTNTVPEGANRYWWKVMVPTLEFGAMHAILFQMALIPLTMSRFSISALSESVISRFVPMNRMLRIHIHLGYIMVILVFISTLLFLTFFGLLCGDGEQAFCRKMRSEIMITGYVIIAFMLILGITSFNRHNMPYEVFYGIHHLVFIIYILTIIHTFDGEQRSGAKERSQTFKWFSSTLLYYFCDRAAMALNHRYKTPLVASSVVQDNGGSKMVILRLRRPVLFHFKPGQYAQLRLPEIDRHWHPFSIASGPGSACLEFYIEVFDKKGEEPSTSWSHKLWELLQTQVEGDGRRIEFEVMGPYGTALAKTENFSHAIAIGTGTGIVPVLSLFKQHVRQLLRLEPESFLRTLEERQSKIIELECAEDERKGSIAAIASRPCCGDYLFLEQDPLCAHDDDDDNAEDDDDMSVSKRAQRRRTLRHSIHRHGELSRWGDVRENMINMKHAAFAETRSIYGVVLLSALPVMGVALFGLTISWNTCNFELRYGMIESLQVLTVIFQAFFAFVAFFIWDGSQFFALIDAVVCVIAPFADWYWFLQYAKYEQLTPSEVTLYCILVGYMTARLWSMVVRPRHRSWRSNLAQDDGFGGTLDRLELVWVTRSASLVSKIMPEIHVLWDTLVAEWGRENAAKVCRISIHVTDADEDACDILRQEFADLDLYRAGAVRFGRPDFCEVIEQHTLDMVATRSKSYSLLAFCGSTPLAQEIHAHKISNDMVAGITGNKHHQMEYVSESYGGYKSRNVSSDTKRPKNSSSGFLGLNKRRSVRYANF
ncbi:generating NADPH oxidase heavy chain subunit [Seminavis robusta]|uniref:Generating NADPH oxidase heavy chain subunit n=1 Tax=Seminavis robusta TaxID=568900 RepID=A0A9N8E3M3_9STRA|nr:generating NADPH oxidase heavy chain subunit [Seminavis robusta]|eukprot:Sro491_g153640.1 generating NADPH oxidase heavy chain subunit (913) ;mRNA; r:9436-12373